MAHNLTASEQLAHSTVRIECATSEGPGTGTGFFFRCLDDGNRFAPAIITNKHVVAGATNGWFHLTLVNEDGTPRIGSHIRIEMADFQQRWIGHPDPAVDLCLMPIQPLMEEASRAGHRFFFITLERSLIPS